MNDIFQSRNSVQQIRRRSSVFSRQFGSDRHVSLTELEQHTWAVHNRSVRYVPTAEHILQSFRNEVESQATGVANMAAITRRDSHPRITRLLNNLDHQTRQARRTSVVQFEPAIDAQMPPISSTTISTVQEDRERQERMLRYKYNYNSRDVLRLAHESEQLRRTLGGASPGALYVFSRRLGSTTETYECHGFCYNIPVNVRISSYPVSEEEAKSSRNRKVSSIHFKRILSKEKLISKWSHFCISSHSAFYFCPSVPFHRMLNIRHDELLITADSGDLLLEGSFMSDTQQYIQYKSKSLTAQAALIYKSPESGVLYVLTSRKWPRNLRTGYDQPPLQDILSNYQRDGVQMCSLEAYLQKQRSLGVYYIYRRLSRKRRSATPRERSSIGQQLYQWYIDHQHYEYPDATELRRRLKEYMNLRAGGSLTKSGVKIMAASRYTSSQTVMHALIASGILSDSHRSTEVCFSVSGYFEMKNMTMAPNLGSLAWTYEVMTVVSGIRQSRSVDNSNVYIRMVEDGSV